MSEKTSTEVKAVNRGPKEAAFYALTVFISLAFALLVIEMALRSADYITSINMTRNAAVDRWIAKHWQANELGYRDLPLTPRLSSTKPKIYFLGDSFTAGHGVDLKDTFYFRIGVQLEEDYSLFNISRPGLSTLGEHNELSSFNKAIASRPDIAVHQYFVNDIEDYISKPAWEPPGWLALLSRHLESAQLIETLLFNREHGQAYRRLLLDAYRNPAIMRRHEGDLEMLHQHVREDGGAVIFLVFPALNQKDLRASSFVISEMRGFFSRTCQPNDIFIDATPAALSLKESERVASFLNDHPSPELHRLIANQVMKAIRRERPDNGGYKAYETCESLKATRTPGAGTQT